MSGVRFDTHEVVKELKSAGFSDEQAEAVTRVVRDVWSVDLSSLPTKADLSGLATKGDVQVGLAETKADMEVGLAQTKADMRVSLAETKAEILKWMVGSIGIQTVVIIGAVIALVRMAH